MTTIRITNGAVDIITVDGQDHMAIRGVIDPTSIAHIKVDAYQREVLPETKISVLKKALLNSRVPDIDLGMRGDDVTEQGDGIFLLNDDVYVIDGLQRKSAAEQLVLEGGAMPHLGALIHFDSNEQWERERFENLNVGQTGLNGNVILRNMAHSCSGAQIMLQITEMPSFVLDDRIAWGQNMRRKDLLSATTFYRVVGRLHSHAGPGKGDPRSLARTGIAKITTTTGKRNFTDNVKFFFAIVDEIFGLQNIAYRTKAVQLRLTFLVALAGVLSDHEDFWDDYRLIMPAELKKKLAKFPLSDPHVESLSGSSGKAVFMMEQILVDHINANKRTRRLTKRAWIAENEADETENEGGVA